MTLQEWIHRLEEGRWARTFKFSALILGFVVLALLYDFRCYRGFATQEAMENAQLARNISEGKGFSTDSIMPSSLALIHLQLKQNKFNPEKNLPDINTPPVYPLLIAGLMKVLPFHFQATESPVYQPELWIAFFNQALFLIAALLVFQIARSLFDPAVAWFSALIFLATDLFWRFSLSGLATLWLIVLFLALFGCLLKIETLQREEISGTSTRPNRSLWFSLGVGILLGLGALSCYSFGWLIIPVVIFLWFVGAQKRVRLILAATITFGLLLVPWLVRNYSLSGQPFGASGYALVQGTWAFPEDTFERTTDLKTSLNHVHPDFFLDKGIDNLRDILQQDLPKIGGNWIVAFFLAGLFLPFRNPALSRLRLFLLGALGLFILVEALGRTHLSADSVQINSENLLVVLAPLIIIYGAGMLLTLFGQMGEAGPTVRNFLLAVMGAVLCAPLILGFAAAPPYPLTVPYFPAHIQRTCGWMGPREPVMSDIPWAVAWYGHRPSLLLSLDTAAEFVTLQKLMPINAVYLTQRTGDKHFQTRAIESPKSWEHLLVGVWAHDEIPDGFPFWKAPAGYWPDQTFLSDRAGWLEPAPKTELNSSKKQ